MKLRLLITFIVVSLRVLSQEDSSIITMYLNIIEGDDPNLKNERNILNAKLFVKRVENEISKTSEEHILSYYYFYLGDIHFRLKEYNQSIATFSECLSKHCPDSGMVYSNIFSSYKLLGKPDSAIYTISKAIELDPSYQLYYLKKAKLYVDDNKVEEASSFCVDAIKKNPNFLEVADVYLNLIYEKRPEKLKREAKKLLRINENLFVSYFYLVKYDYKHSNNTKRTKSYLKKLEEMDTHKIYLALLDIK